MAISASQITASQTLEEFRREYNNNQDKLVIDDSARDLYIIKYTTKNQSTFLNAE